MRKIAHTNGVESTIKIRSFRERMQIPEDDLHWVEQFWDFARQNQKGSEAYPP